MGLRGHQHVAFHSGLNKSCLKITETSYLELRITHLEIKIYLIKGTELDYIKLALLVFSANSHTFNLKVPQTYSYRNSHDIMLNLKSRTQSYMYTNTLKKELMEDF